jgi:protocatechuate 3,4-dioxygenase beta subunit
VRSARPAIWPTLIAKPDLKTANLLHFDIRIQGANETVFFDA